MLARTKLADLKRWYTRTRRKPLVIRGARQVGKTALVRAFAEKEKLKLYEINLEKYPRLDSQFKTLDMNVILRELEGILGKKIETERSILFLDEIQSTPWALAALRYFFEDRPDLAVVTAGSLLEFVLTDHSFSMPVGRVEYLHLGPMTFKEFLLAMRESHLSQEMERLTFSSPLAISTHEKLLFYFREFLFVGGMPEAVLSFSETKDLFSVREVQDSILSTYQNDFAKYIERKEDRIRLQQIFEKVPSQIGKKIKYTTLLKDEKSQLVRSSIEMLSKARVINTVFHSHSNGIPLGAERNDSVFKLIFLDVGLVTRMLGVSSSQLVNEGPIAEQFIGQELWHQSNEAMGPQLYFWLREGKLGNAEVDYVTTHDELVVPIEVKAGKSGSLRSLHQFMAEKRGKLAVRFDLNLATKNEVKISAPTSTEAKNVSFTLLSLPLYLIGEMPRILQFPEKR